jgi:hypothetical protein
MPDRTNAERQRRFHQKRIDEITRLAARVAELEAALAAAAVAPQPAPALEPQPTLAAENLRLRSRVGALEQENTRLRAQPRPAAAPRPVREPRPVDEEVARLQAQITRIRQEVRLLRARLRDVTDSPNHTLLMPAADIRSIRAGLHPDNATEGKPRQRLDKASQIFNSLVASGRIRAVETEAPQAASGAAPDA